MGEKLKSPKAFNNTAVQKNFDNFFRKVDVNGDNKVDRSELYSYCLSNSSIGDEL